ncbi:TadE family protein [Sphingomonas sp. SAFR-052]|uniref:TadE family protein n=1 Tax=Sphingomonas sp. SAFR-052 TaxID=3436867 RepID=UPI003F7CF746
MALLEFALGLPLVLAVGLYAVETANLALTNMRVHQIAQNLADNASRVGDMNSDSIKQLREIDINDVLTATRLQGERIDLTTRGRVTISSLEQGWKGVQYLHWQRCIGLMRGPDYDSSYDRTYGTMDRDDGIGTNWWNGGVNMPNGMGDQDPKVQSPVGSGVMYIEVNYEYRPIVGTAWLPGGSARIHATAAFVIRDRRNFDQIYNPEPAAPRYYCDAYSAT